jgi:O-antigen/teichoic acid export membrane protein
MLAERVEGATLSADTHRATFFRQSGWLMIANIAGGILMWGVHFLAKKIPDAEYAVFGAMLAMIMCVPAGPLQMVFAQQTAWALATHRERELTGMIRMVWAGTLVLWLVALGVVFVSQGALLARWQVTNPAALWVTMLVVLLSLWLPLFSGVLQGQQNFAWLGGTMILNGVGRMGVAALVVLLLGGYAAGMLTGTLLGIAAAVVVAVWQTRGLWRGPSQSFNRRSLLGQVVPLMLGFGAFQFLFTADTMFVKSYFLGDDTAPYVGAGTMSRALMWLVGPLAGVMFPKLVHSAAKGQKSNLLGMVLVGTVVLAAGGALGVGLLGPWIIKFVYKDSYVSIATSILPWYAWGMLPLAVANVLINHLLAHAHFRVVPALVVLAGAYAFALTRFHDSFVMVLQVFGVSNLLLMAIAAWFTWWSPKSGVSSPESAV